MIFGFFSPYIIDSSVQLVCKYLHAYKHRKNIKHGINRRYIEKGENSY